MNNSFSVAAGKLGEIISICKGQCEYACPAAEAFTMQFLDEMGNAYLLKSSGFTFDGINYTGHPSAPAVCVTVDIRRRDAEVRFRPSVTGIPANWVLEWFDGPQICFDKRFRLFHPRHDGVEITDYQRPKNYHPIAFAKRGVVYGTAFPGRAQIQCLGVYGDDGSGFYFGAHDASCCTKAVEYEVLPDSVRLSLQCFTGCRRGEAWSPDFDFILAPLDHGWRGACLIYRNFLESIHGVRYGKFPAFMEKSPVMLIYPVRGKGLDTGDMTPNCYYPYSNAMPVVEKFAEEMDSKIMALLMHWEGTAPWAPPYVWPPFGGEDALAKFRDQLHEQGHLLGLYCSGVAWTCQSSITDYAPGCTAEEEKFMLRGPKGELEATICNGKESQRLGYDMCMAQPEARQIAMDEILKMAAFDVDYSQFFDQNHGGAMHNCYAGDHDHPPVPGSWQTTAMRSFMAETVSRIRAMGKEMILGCESAAAEPFAEFLALNDARASFMQFTGETVPAQQFVFHGLSCNFSGNQCGAKFMDFAAHPEDLCRRIAYGFNAGDLLSVTLKEDGNIHWAWAYGWEHPAPNQENVITLVRNLNALRRQFPEFFLYGRMILPKDRIAEEFSMKKMYSGRELRIPSFYHNCWEAPDGRQVTVICNYLDCAISVKVNDVPVEIPPLNAVMI